MTALELCQLVASSGVLTMGGAAWAWVLRTERRLIQLELKAKLA
jgi:hypothetical protein